MPARGQPLWSQKAVSSRPRRITVCVGVPGSLYSISFDGLVLVIEADTLKSNRFYSDLCSFDAHTLLYQEVLSSRRGDIIHWLTFNDGRFNGTVSEKTLRSVHPNLRKTGDEVRIGSLLCDVLDIAGLHLAEGSLTPWTLCLNEGDPLAAIEGLGDWMYSLHSVHLSMPRALSAYWMPALSSKLESLNFTQVCSAEDCCWQRDLALSMRLLYNDNQKLRSVLSRLEAAVLGLECEGSNWMQISVLRNYLNPH